MDVLCVVQARMASSRLPGKIAMGIGTEPMLTKVLHRLARASTVDAIAVATTDDPSDDLTAELAGRAGASVVRGSALDVQSRFVTLVHTHPADVVVRVTADCPFTDPDIVDDAVRLYAGGQYDYVTNQPAAADRRTFPLGLAVEVFAARSLLAVADDAPSAAEREHVTPRFYTDPAFAVGVLATDPPMAHLRWTVDVAEDLAVVRALDELAGPEPFGWTDVARVAQENPQIGARNASVAQKSHLTTDARWH